MYKPGVSDAWVSSHTPFSLDPKVSNPAFSSIIIESIILRGYSRYLYP
ncbi:hypothetical protein Vsou_21080 [Vulcanisaeta souniana JCM 11219]|uniref:Uncharacterized protein n=1 Tax=Vulcanisaeta souniana JCM 11219 TaxID=1293586 RepID=A0ABM8BPT9_9CREN|nr:hypothetical protein Vsou_21080 [Vulcanisaeta souniana JCM 11219]